MYPSFGVLLTEQENTKREYYFGLLAYSFALQECSAHLGTWSELFETFQFPFLTLLPAPLAIASFQEENLVAQILSFIIQAGRSMYSCILYLLQCHLSSTVLS